MPATETSPRATPPTPTLTRHDPPDIRGVVLLLHGGQQHSTERVDGRSASWRRSLLMQRSITPRAHEAGVATWLLRYRFRGWNGGTGPVADARWALEEVRRTLGDVPVVLLGHSMGGRTAVHVAADPAVRGVVALAPWLPADEPVVALAGRTLTAAHGRRDRITSYEATAAYVERAADVAKEAMMVDMGPVGHYMLRSAAEWNDVATGAALDLLA